MSRPCTIAAPIGVSPWGVRTGAWNWSAVWKSLTTETGPKLTIPTSTRFAARASPISSSLKSVRPALSSEIGRPAIEPELSRSRRQGQRGSGLSANSAAAKFDSLEYGTWSNDDIVSPRRKRNDNFWLFLMRRQEHQVPVQEIFVIGEIDSDAIDTRGVGRMLA